MKIHVKCAEMDKIVDKKKNIIHIRIHAITYENIFSHVWSILQTMWILIFLFMGVCVILRTGLSILRSRISS